MNAKRILVFGNLLIMALAFWMTASIALTWVHQRRDAEAEDLFGSRGSRAAVPRQGRTLADYGIIAKSDVFHSAKVDSGDPAGEAANIQITERNLQLKGTVVGEGPRSYAVIVDHDSSREDVYFQDDFVMGARIARILQNRVILDANGKEEALLMADERRALPEMRFSGTEPPDPGVAKPMRSVRRPVR